MVTRSTRAAVRPRRRPSPTSAQGIAHRIWVERRRAFMRAALFWLCEAHPIKRRIRVSFPDVKAMSVKEYPGEDILGVFDPVALSITVAIGDKRCNAVELLDTLAHEYRHADQHARGLDWHHNGVDAWAKSHALGIYERMRRYGILQAREIGTLKRRTRAYRPERCGVCVGYERL